MLLPALALVLAQDISDMSGLAAWAFQGGRSQAHDIAPEYKREKRKRELNTPKKKTGRPPGSGAKHKENIARHPARLSDLTVSVLNRLMSQNDTKDQCIYRNLIIAEGTSTYVTQLEQTIERLELELEESRRQQQPRESKSNPDPISSLRPD